MSFIYGNGNDENVVPKSMQSSNAYANGADQNCGNVITDRPTTRLHAPPGGHSQICFGLDPRDDPANQPARSQMTQQAQDYAMNSKSNVHSQVFGVPSSANANSSNAFANGADQNCGNFITDRPTTRLHAPPGGRSQISFGSDNVCAAPVTSSRPNTAAAAAKEREQTGSDIFGAAPAPVPQQQQQQQEWVTEEAPLSQVEASETHIKPMMIAELRTLCREHGLSPAGAKPTLVSRLCEAIAAGQIKIMVANKGTSGVSNVGNNYGRAEGQNVGNFMTGRNSSRILAPPGGGSTFSLGGYGSEPAPTTGNMSEAKALEISGHDIFADEASHGHAHMSETKAAHLRGHDVFADEPAAFVPSRVQSELKMQRDVYSDNVFSEKAEPHRPGTAQSRAKVAEISGQDIFSDGGGFITGEVSESRAARQAAMGGQDVFSNETGVTRRIIGGVTKPPGGDSNIIF